MAERMKRMTLSIPAPLKSEWQAVVKKDGRSEGEIIRALIEQWVRETQYCKARLQATR
jgi:metal-responsive CopG/Arc/MetJ family transcriptional regulator